MKHSDLDIDAIVIESPCSVPWDSMRGDDVKRYCGACRLHVYDLSQMTRPQIQRLHRATDGNFCKRLWRRADGRVITKDCRRIVPALRRRVRAIGAAVAGLFALTGLLGCTSRTRAPCPCPPDTSAEEPAQEPAPQPPEPGATAWTGR